MQVFRQIMPLFEIKQASFKFYENVSTPFTELTGLSISTQDLILRSLRVLRDWSVLKDKLPCGNSMLGNISENKVTLNLDEWEKQVWELASQNISLNEIAKILKLNINKVQQAAFRLICIGLVEEIPMLAISTSTEDYDLKSHNNDNLSENSLISSFYINKLLNFLENNKTSPVTA
jgi:hypothetical protein